MRGVGAVRRRLEASIPHKLASAHSLWFAHECYVQLLPRKEGIPCLCGR